MRAALIPYQKRAPFTSRLFRLILCLLLLAGLELAKVHAAGDHPGEDKVAAINLYALGTDKPYFSHIHGIGYLPESEAVTIAAHDGLWFFAEEGWSHPDIPFHDYMGFAPVHDGFYASGHPDRSTDLPNPLGLVKVTEGGRHISRIRFEGELDFHLLAAGYYARSLYVYNEKTIPDLSSGLHYSEDGGKNWISATGYTGTAPYRLAAHPGNSEMMALISGESVFVTVDYGKNFRRIEPGFLPTAITFHPDSTSLLVGGSDLLTYNLNSLTAAASPHPDIPAGDGISYIAVHHANPKLIAVATLNRSVFVSWDAGATWLEITATEATNK